ncbi:MAG: methylmalonyl Co-A mutase-associated GTPase MeaB [Hyphomicrobiales bacterium]|nr:methylmalonyl Co-A mutase-associated GTPase MeaB [Hyphomicrobiales bacterium]
MKAAAMTLPSQRAEEFAKGVLARERATLGRAITLIESSSPNDRADAAQLLRLLLPRTGSACRIGISGAPGAGKSSLIETLGCELLERGHRVAVLAVDPSSANNGGSILADKTRMQKLAASSGAFIRPSPSAGASGGVARASFETVLLCEAAGFDIILVETVGVGQIESAVADMVDIFVLLALPGAGDELQGIKKGTLERADIILVTKADGEREDLARAALARYQEAVSILATLSSRHSPHLALCSAHSGFGITDLCKLLEKLYVRLKDSGALEARRGKQRVRRMKLMLESELMALFLRDKQMRSWLHESESELLEGATTPFLVIDDIIERFEGKLTGGS